jgi:methylmalonyl-CoA/ethylmalonyl-CoA epimerase
MDSLPEQQGLKEIGQILIPVRDIKRAVDFYRDTLRMKYLFDIPNAAFFECGGIRLMLGVPETPELDHPASIIYYRVADIQSEYKWLFARGVKFEGEPHLIARMESYDLWMCFFHDGEGNLLALMSEKIR